MSRASTTRAELSRFLLIGVLTVLVDFATYRMQLALALPTALAKTTGFIAGTVFAYFANRHWTFGGSAVRGGSALRFALLYALTLGINVAANAWLLSVLKPFGGAVNAILLAFCGATGLSAALNFLGMKFFVFTTATTPRSGA